MSEVITNKLNGIKIKNKRESGLMGLPPLPALIVTVVYSAAVISAPRYDISLIPGLALYPVFAAAAAGTDLRRLFCRFLPVLPLILLTGLSDIYINREAAALLYGITITRGLISFITLLSKALLTVTALFLFAEAYTEEEIADALVSAGLPVIMASSLLLTIRYTGELKREVSVMVTAWRAKACGRGPVLRDSGPLLAAFFIRCAERAGRTSYAMRCRGWKPGRYKALQKRPSGGQLLVFTALLLLALLPRAVNLYKISEKLLTRAGI